MTILNQTKKNAPEVHFNSAQAWAEFTQLALKGKVADLAPFDDSDDAHSNAHEHMTSRDSLQDSWRGKCNGDKALKNIKERKVEQVTLKKINDRAESLEMFAINGLQEQEEFTLFNDESGLMLDSNAYFNGEESCMINYDIDTTTKPTLWIACCIGGMASIEPEQFINRGIALIRCVKALEISGVSVGLVGYSKATIESSGVTIKPLQTLVVKRPEQDLDEAALINVFAHCGAFRTIGFAVRNVITNLEDAGSTRTASKSDFKNSYAKGENLVVLPYDGMGQYNNDLTATNWTREQINKQTSIVSI